MDKIRVLLILCLGSCMTLVDCELIRGPVDVVTVKGSKITLPCSTSLYEHIRWEFKRFDSLEYEPIDLKYKREHIVTGNTLFPGERYLMTIDSTGSEYNLTIWSVQIEDAGTYRCVEESHSGGDGTPDQKSAEVVVADDFRCKRNYCKGEKLHVGYHIKLICTLTNIIGNKSPKFRWSIISDESDDEVVLFHPESRTFYNTEGNNKTMTSKIHLRATEGLNKTFARCSTLLRETNSFNFGISFMYPNTFADFTHILISDYIIGPSIFGEFFTDDFLIVSDAHFPGLFQVQIPTGKVRLLSAKYMSHPAAVDIDPVNMDVYFTDASKRSIARFSFHTKETQFIYQDLEGMPLFTGLILDAENKLLYVSDAKELTRDKKNSLREMDGSIIEFGLDGKIRCTIIKERGMCPTSPQLDKLNSVLYWADICGEPGIYKISLLYPFKKIPIITTGIVWPNAFVVDFKSKEMFWADEYTYLFETASVDGSNRRVLKTFHHAIFGMTLTTDYIFFTGNNEKAVQFYDRRKSEFLHYTKHTFKHLHGITHYQSEDNHWDFKCS